MFDFPVPLFPTIPPSHSGQRYKRTHQVSFYLQSFCRDALFQIFWSQYTTTLQPGLYSLRPSHGGLSPPTHGKHRCDIWLSSPGPGLTAYPVELGTQKVVGPVYLSIVGFDALLPLLDIVTVISFIGIQGTRVEFDNTIAHPVEEIASWVTMSRLTRLWARYSSSHSVMSRSRWLVGSSSISRSGSAISTLANATRFCCPPDNCPMGCSKSLISNEKESALLAAHNPMP